MKKAIKIALMILLVASILFVLTGCGEEKKNPVVDNNTVTEEPKVEFSMGEWKDNTYENKFLGLKFNLPEGWTYSSDEEIAQMMNIGSELLNDDQKIAAELAKLTSVYYVVANDPSTGNNISIMSEKPLMDITTEYYLDQLKTQLTAVESMSYEIGDTSKEKVAGREYDTLTVTAAISGIEVTQKYYVYKMDEYFVCVIATSTSGERGIEDIMKSFE
ncbi:MAG: hypothetical protein IJB90_00565 [Clostridia bacterium]|nr:hypothetical protein [Clostridia bacterium]